MTFLHELKINYHCNRLTASQLQRLRPDIAKSQGHGERKVGKTSGVGIPGPGGDDGHCR